MMKKIVVIEDNDDMRENICELLELSDYSVFDAPNGKVGVELVKKELPDLVLCDVMMPGIDGHSVLYMLSQNAETSNIPFIFLTAKAEKEDFREGMNLGADDYLTKPFQEMDLLKAINKRIDRKKSRKKAVKIEGETLAIIQKSLQKCMDNEQVKYKQFDKKQHIYYEGDSSNYLYVVKSGLVRVFLENEDGKEITLDVFSKGDFFGLTSFLNGNKFIQNAATVLESEIVMIPKELVSEQISQDGGLSVAISAYIAEKLKQRNAQIIEMAYDSVRMRVAKTLVKLDEVFKGKAISLSREELSSMVGTSTESVIRMLSEFKNDDYITVSGGDIEILKKEDLISSYF